MIITILILIIVLGILIFVHELGHFVMAKKMKMGIEEFGFGYPPRIFGIQKNKDGNKKKWRLIFLKDKKDDENTNTIYSINWIPFGGFVKIKGEQGDKQEEKDSFTSKKIWKRAIVLSAGVTMNIVFAFVLISIGFSLGLPAVIDDSIPSSANITDKNVQIIQIEEGSPAEEAGIEIGDMLEQVDSTIINSTEDFQQYVKPKLDQTISLSLKRGDETIVTDIIPADLNDDGKGRVGVWLANTGLISYTWYQAIWMGAKTTVSVTWQILVAFYDLIKNLIVEQQVSADVAGPIGIAVLTGQIAKLGFIYLLQFTAILSINLAIINYIPFPALDGGRVLFLIIEKIKGKPINQKIEGTIHSIGFFVLISFLLFITFKDITKFSDSIGAFFTNLL